VVNLDSEQNEKQLKKGVQSFKRNKIRRWQAEKFMQRTGCGETSSAAVVTKSTTARFEVLVVPVRQPCNVAVRRVDVSNFGGFHVKFLAKCLDRIQGRKTCFFCLRPKKIKWVATSGNKTRRSTTQFRFFNRKNRNTSTLLNHFDTTFHSAGKFTSDVGASQQQRREELELGRSLFLLFFFFLQKLL
jgi:hypothetical protein